MSGSSESGLMSLALHPQFASIIFVLAYAYAVGDDQVFSPSCASARQARTGGSQVVIENIPRRNIMPDAVFVSAQTLRLILDRRCYDRNLAQRLDCLP